ncbi:MAG: hypothetical protein LAO24_21755 [Acidobacteriia bacterium]|nr:hypothetical protein [Terriglobia bacterium]
MRFDPIHKLFLVAQPVSSTAFSGSSILVFDELGNFKESIDGLNFSNTFNVIPTHIALKPSNRSGFVDGPDAGVTESPVVHLLAARVQGMATFAFRTERRDSWWYLNGICECAVLRGMAGEKNPKKDIVLWIITVALLALAYFWYKK